VLSALSHEIAITDPFAPTPFVVLYSQKFTIVCRDEVHDGIARNAEHREFVVTVGDVGKILAHSGSRRACRSQKLPV
jgi:hypothetical protein